MRTRSFFAVLTLAALAALVFAFGLEYVGGLEPCPLCIFQRIAMFGVLAVSAAGWLHNPGAIGHRVYAGLAMLAGAVGAAIAARHVWLIHLPPDQVPACGPGLDYLVQVMPLSDVVGTVLRGDASCATVKGSFVGISLPGWTLIVFVALVLFALVGLARGKRESAPTSR
ncbi:disulfide bond formation protein B [Salinisphaera japonica]|uniref:Disulfide bond formation protein B n=1 Tax=Salinisphaera japonica YTM-1 TaxID=1209778 RepID=A0A423PM45_9GAMM|nr:disulfide bond formation protein B [Salinisphaera japonica]ROO26571.1 dihydrolipoamide acetyltransferase [Salinisphaera japonica YTM-1]